LAGTTWGKIARESRAVIASQRVGAKRRPMTGSAKQSIDGRNRQQVDCFAGFASSQ
jgi:hypothetical protein